MKFFYLESKQSLNLAKVITAKLIKFMLIKVKKYHVYKIKNISIFLCFESSLN